MASKYRKTGVAGLLLIVVLTVGGVSAAAGPRGTVVNPGWVESSAGPDSGEGSNNNVGHSWNASRAISPDGMSFITWSDESSGYTYTGDPDDLYDVFFFESQAAGPITIRLDNHVVGGVQLSLLDSAFTLIDRDYEPPGGYRLDLTNQLPGRYYIVVHAAEPKPGSTTRYTLRATFAD